MEMVSQKKINRVNLLNISDGGCRCCRQPIGDIPGLLSDKTNQLIETIMDLDPAPVMEERYGIMAEGFF